MKKVDPVLPFSSVLCFLQVQTSNPYKMHLQSTQMVQKQARKLQQRSRSSSHTHMTCCLYLVGCICPKERKQ